MFVGDVVQTDRNRHRVAPPGSTVCRAVARSRVMRYTTQGGGPAEGALNSAVRAAPDSSTRAGQPWAFHLFAMVVTVSVSRTCSALPSTTRSNACVARLNVQRGSLARFLPFRVCSPVSNQNVPSTHNAPTPVTWGLPSGLRVANQQVCRSGPPDPGAWDTPSSRRTAMLSQSSRGSSSRSARFRASVGAFPGGGRSVMAPVIVPDVQNACPLIGRPVGPRREVEESDSGALPRRIRRVRPPRDRCSGGRPSPRDPILREQRRMSRSAGSRSAR